MYQSPNFTWLSHIAGGVLFGVGMTLASGCGSKTLIRIGGGNLKSVVVFVFLGISAYMTLRGLFGAFRASVFEPIAVQLPGGQDLPTLLAQSLAAPERTVTLAVALLIAGLLLAFVFARREFLQFDNVLGGVVVGLVVVGGWYVSGELGYIAEDPNTLQEAFVATNSGRMESFSFVAPNGYFLEYLMLWTDKSKIVTFGIAATMGVVAGSFAYAVTSKTFRWESFRDSADMLRHMAGGILMGFGGVTALGCTIGQGITGFSTLAAGSLLTFASIIAGAAATMKYQQWQLSRAE
jgi:uncharacterized membrane protein YedE/YeeE